MAKHLKLSGKLLTLSITTLLLVGTRTAWADSTVYGINNDSGTTLTVTDSTDKTVAASSDTAGTPALAYGIATTGYGSSPIIIEGDLHMVAQATHSAGGEFHAYAAYAGNGPIHINTVDGTSGLGKKTQIEGDLMAYNDDVVAYFDTADSYFKGNFKGSIGNSKATFANGATWLPVFDNRYGTLYDEDDPATHSPSYVDTGLSGAYLGGTVYGGDIVLNNGIVNLTWDNPTRTDSRELLSDYSGSGTFIVNTNITKNPISSDSMTANSDFLNLSVFDSTAALTLKVNYDPGFAQGKNFTGVEGTGQVVSNNGTGKLSVNATGTAYNAKTFTPTIVEEDQPGVQSWRITGYTVSSGLGVTPNINVTSVADGHYALHSLWLDESNSLTKRMGELRDTNTKVNSGIWARYNYNKLEAGSGSKADIKANLFQLGYDVDSQGAHGVTYTGGAVSYAKGTSEFSGGNGNLKETTLSLYRTYVDEDGHYYDIVLKGGKFMNDFKIRGSSVAASDSDYSTWAYSLSGEYGKRIPWGNNFYVEPQAEFTLGRMNKASYTTSTGMSTTADASNLALMRLGVAAGRKFKTGNIYARASYFHDFGSGVSISADDVHYTRGIARNWGEFALGGNIKAGKNCNIYGEVTKYVGQLTSPVGFNVGARWSF